MQFETFTGTVSHGHERVTVRGGKKAVSSKVTTTFRLDGTPVTMEGPASIGDGDVVTVAGERKGGEFVAYILRNETTGATYNEASVQQFAFVGLLFAVSVVLMAVIVGFVLFAVACWYAFKMMRVVKAQNLLKRTPPPVVRADSAATPQPAGAGA